VIQGGRRETTPPEPKARFRFRLPRISSYWWIIAMLFSAFGMGVGSGLGLGLALRSGKCAT